MASDEKMGDKKNKKNLQIENNLKKALKENGLNPNYWGEKFAKNGIKNCFQLKHIDKKTIETLHTDAEHEWEKKALDKLKTDGNEEKRNQQLEHTTKLVMETLKTMHDSNDEEERRKKFVHKFNEGLSHRELHKNLTKWDTHDKELVERTELDPLTIIENISSGKILRGTFFHTDMRNCVMPRRKLIQILQTEITLMFPSTSERYESMEFFDQTHSQAFDHVIEHWGISAAAGVGVGFGIFQLNIGYKHDTTDESQHENSGLSAFTEIKDVEIVKTASFSLEDVDHSISDEALYALQDIEKFPDDLEKKYNLFFAKFGSHYFTGTYKFGGIFKTSVQCRSRETMEKSDTLKLVKNSLQASVSGMYGSIAGSASASGDKSKDEHNINFKKDEDYKINKIRTLIGGPPEVDNIPDWKVGLVKYNKTWAVIEKVNFNCEEKWRGVWNLITDDLDDQFKDICMIREDLKRYWKKFNEVKKEGEQEDKKKENK